VVAEKSGWPGPLFNPANCALPFSFWPKRNEAKENGHALGSFAILYWFL